MTWTPVDWRKWLVCDNSSFWRFFWALERFLHLCNSNTLCVFPSLFLFLSLPFPLFFCQGGGAEIQHLPVFISCTVTGWTALTSARGLKHAGRSEPGFFLTASVNAHPCEHTIWETALCQKERKTERKLKVEIKPRVQCHRWGKTDSSPAGDVGLRRAGDASG